ncbi:MAG: hypothetical protein IPG58_20935 [Acidobacteria bacterium]|nr:hypothetical protein [Acidobacteriota bacterium]
MLDTFAEQPAAISDYAAIIVNPDDNVAVVKMKRLTALWSCCRMAT